MGDKYKITTIDGRDYVSVHDAKRILGVSSAKELRSLGRATVQIGNHKPLWSLAWVISQAKAVRSRNAFQPDFDWIAEYQEGVARFRAGQARKTLTLNRSTRKAGGTTAARLKQLVEIMPPPDEMPSKVVDWAAVEGVVGVEYPESFKQFIAVYGGLRWFDFLQPLVPVEGQSPEQFIAFLGRIFDENFGEDTKDEDGDIIATPRFGTPGGFLPFMVGDDGDGYAWLTEGSPECWGMICVRDRQVILLPPISIAEMLVGWLTGDPFMDRVWGSIDEFRSHSPDRVTMLR